MPEKFKCTNCGSWFIPDPNDDSDWCPACNDDEIEVRTAINNYFNAHQG